MSKLKIAIAQLDPVVGAFDANYRKIKAAYERACADGVDLLLTPELGICGYPPHDLMDRPEMFSRTSQVLQLLAEETRNQSCDLVVGHVTSFVGEVGRAAQNCVSILSQGQVVFTQAKSLLPTYDVFDEARYFEPARETLPFEWRGVKVGIAVCEDLWASDPALTRRIYRRDPVEDFEKAGVELVISISASPYEWGKRKRREELHAAIARRLKAPLVYVNQVGATDEILFDGSSFVVDAQGVQMGRLPAFEKGHAVLQFEVDSKKRSTRIEWLQGEREDQQCAEIELLARGLVTGIREYFQRTGFKSAVLGLSGGIDSAVVAALAVKALGAEQVLGVAMPSQYSSGHSLEDAEESARKLGMPFEIRPIKFLFSTSLREIADQRGELAPVAQENLQSRMRGLILMTLANHYQALVLTTGNKSELATGYCTLYGDMVGALAPLGDVLKTRVYELARYINSAWGAWIPQNSIDKAPSAELRPNQKDQDSLPPYERLDSLLEMYLEKGIAVETILQALGGDTSWVESTLKMVERNEFKRRQAAPVLKVSPKAFGIGRRIPVAKQWEGAPFHSR